MKGFYIFLGLAATGVGVYFVYDNFLKKQTKVNEKKSDFIPRGNETKTKTKDADNMFPLRLGSGIGNCSEEEKKAVEDVQIALNNMGATLEVDKQFGAKTQAALIEKFGKSELSFVDYGILLTKGAVGVLTGNWMFK